MSLAELEEVKDGEESEDKEEVTGKQKTLKINFKRSKLRRNYIQLIYIMQLEMFCPICTETLNNQFQKGKEI